MHVCPRGLSPWQRSSPDLCSGLRATASPSATGCWSADTHFPPNPLCDGEGEGEGEGEGKGEGEGEGEGEGRRAEDRAVDVLLHHPTCTPARMRARMRTFMYACMNVRAEDRAVDVLLRRPDDILRVQLHEEFDRPGHGKGSGSGPGPGSGSKAWVRVRAQVWARVRVQIQILGPVRVRVQVSGSGEGRTTARRRTRPGARPRSSRQVDGGSHSSAPGPTAGLG